MATNHVMVMSPTEAEKPVSDGAQLFDFHAARGTLDPDQHAPASWRLSFVEAGDGETLLGLFRSCRSGRDLVLGIAPRAQLQIDLGPWLQTDLGPWHRHLEHILQSLRTRGPLPTTVTIRLGEKPKLVQALDSLEDLLHEVGHSVSELTILRPAPVSHSYKRPEQVEASTIDREFRLMYRFLESVLPAHPHLTKLHSDYCPRSIPSPSQLPQLKQLSFRIPERTSPEIIESACRSIAPFLSQATHLALHEDHDAGERRSSTPRVSRVPWTVLFSAPTTSHTLAHFTTNTKLTDTLLTALLDHAPAVKRLSVGDLALKSEGHSGRQWAVTDLRLTHYWSNDLGMDDLVRLPRPVVGGARVVVSARECGTLWLDADNPQGLDPSLAERLRDYTFQDFMVVLRMSLDMAAAEKLTALRRTLRQVRDLRAPGKFVQITNIRWTAEVAQAVVDAMPELAHLRFCVTVVNAVNGVLPGALPRSRSLAEISSA